MTATQENPYLRDAVLTATPEQLHLMLYDGAIRFASQGREAILAKNIEESYNKLTRAQQIIIEMQNGLNYEVNRELCERMAAIYNFIYQKLIDACVRRDVTAVDDALTVLRYNRESWQMLVSKVNEVRAPDGTDPLELADATRSGAGGPTPAVSSLVAATVPGPDTALAAAIGSRDNDDGLDRSPLSIDA